MREQLPADLADALGTAGERIGEFGRSMHYFAEAGSTNDIAATLAEAGAAEGTLVIASAQTSGRGRLGRVWYSPPGAGLYVSVVFRDSAAVPYLTLAGGVAVAGGIRRATALPVEIKWPNDVVISTGVSSKRRKLAGVLAEGSSSADGLHHVILGFGINLRTAAYPGELADRATSIEAELGRPADRGLVLAETLVVLNTCVVALRRGDVGAVLHNWREWAPSAAGSRVEWDSPIGVRSGIAAGIADDGALLVRTATGVERIISGELVWKY